MSFLRFTRRALISFPFSAMANATAEALRPATTKDETPPATQRLPAHTLRGLPLRECLGGGLPGDRQDEPRGDDGLQHLAAPLLSGCRGWLPSHAQPARLRLAARVTHL